MAEQLEVSHSLLVAAHDFAVDQAGAHLEVVHGLRDEWVERRPVVPPACDEPDAHRVPPGHEPEAVVLNLVNPLRAGRGLSAGEGRQGSMKLARSAARRLHKRSINMRPNLGG